MDSKKFIDVHSFDGKLKIILERKFTKEEKVKLINNSINVFRTKNKKSFLMLVMIRDDLLNDNKKNYDETNDTDASDILANILTGKNIEELYDLIEEQLVDIYDLGQCAQGRVGRLYQIYNIL